jgi:glycosyltransferase 2 family protein
MTASIPRTDATERTRARRFGGLAVGLLVLGFLAWGLVRNWDEVADYDWHLDPALLVAGLAIASAGYAGAAVGYLAVLYSLGVPSTVPRLEVISGWAKSLLGRYVPGTVVMLASRAVLGREVGVPVRMTLAASVYEQTLLLTAGAIASIGFMVGYEGSFALWILLALAAVMGLTLIHPAVFRRLSAWVLRRVGREPLAEFLGLRRLVVLLAYYTIANAFMGVGAWLLVRAAAGQQAGDVTYVALAFLFSFTVGMLAWIIPSGLGVRDAAFAVALARDLPGSVAIALATGVRIALTAVELCFVAVAVALPRIVGSGSPGALDLRFGRARTSALSSHEHERLSEQPQGQQLHPDHVQQDPEEEQRAVANRLRTQPQDCQVGRDREPGNHQGDPDPAE